jgi:putative tryptophan/tyrosine transport system substrate-binding protein
MREILMHLMRSLCALAVAAVTLQPATVGAAPTMIAIGSWFKIGTEVTRDWNIIQPGTDPNILQIRPKRLISSRPLRRLLVLYPRTSSAYDTAITKIVSVFEDKRIDAEITINLFGVDTARGRAALQAAEANHFDLVIGMGSEATAWLWDNYRGGRLPVVSVCSKDPVLLGQMKNYTSGSGNNFAFTSLNMPIDAQMSYILQLRPNLKNFAILVDSSNLSAVQTQAKPASDFARERGIRVFDIGIKPSASLKDELARQVRETVAVMRKNDPDLSNSLFWITGSTIVFNEIATINANSFRVPIVSAVTDVVRAGDDTAALSVGVSFESNAYQAGLYAVGILEGGRAPGEFPVGIVSPPDVAISFRKAREIGLRIPFPLFEGATLIYDNDGALARSPSDANSAKSREKSPASVTTGAPVAPMSFDTQSTLE